MLPDRINGADVFVAPELPLLGGRPDLIVGTGRIGDWQARFDAGVEPLTSRSAVALAVYMESRSSRLEWNTSDLVRRLELTPRTKLVRSVYQLQTSGWLETTDSGNFRLHPQAHSALISVSAVEAKVGRWRSAARQAMAWLALVDHGLLAFPSTYIPNVPRSNPYIAGLGLISIENGVTVNILRKSRHRRPVPVGRRLTEEYLYKRWLMSR